MRILVGCLAAVVIVPLAGLLLLFLWPIWEGNGRLDEFHARVTAYPLPPKAQLRDSDTAISRAPTNGNYCEWLVRLTLQTDLSPAAVQHYYGKAAIVGVNDAAQVAARPGASGSVVVELSDLAENPMDIRCT
ncbi:hypothetical protein EDD27_8887 [Nonomuraea polychroma]|uniref:Uncharacterized protein n=1 Tax=Nonomuraea polychroma TaxID=46176 RepID=A0A438MKE2_9ACTN|nr:hypothetical protein [Nonomuraea polychroma]RVX46045.1 hypothetical protein EDD27_8887 [Nonomuraea polychroma]